MFGGQYCFILYRASVVSSITRRLEGSIGLTLYRASVETSIARCLYGSIAAILVLLYIGRV